MATVTLTALWLNLATNTADYQAFQNPVALVVKTTKDGSVRKLANGRLRAVLGTAKPRVFETQLELCTRTQIDWLEAHVGDLVCVRDDRGRKVYGTYFEVPVTENVFRSDYGDVALVITETTHSEAV